MLNNCMNKLSRCKHDLEVEDNLQRWKNLGDPYTSIVAPNKLFTGGTFVPETFRSRDFRSPYLSFPGLFIPGAFVPNNDYSWDLSLSQALVCCCHAVCFQKIKRWWLCNVRSTFVSFCRQIRRQNSFTERLNSKFLASEILMPERSRQCETWGSRRSVSLCDGMFDHCCITNLPLSQFWKNFWN